MVEQALSSSSVLLFGLYTFISIVGGLFAVFAGRNKASISSIDTVNKIAIGAVEDARLAQKENAKLEGRVEELMRQTSEEKQRADSYAEKYVTQGKQIDDLKGGMADLKQEQARILKRLEQVEDEKKALEVEKVQLEKTIDLKSIEHQRLMATIQTRIETAVNDVRKELTTQYESRINELTEEIRQKNDEITQLKSKLEEKSHDQTQPHPIPADSTRPNPDPQSIDAVGSGIDSRSDGSSGGIDPNNPVAGDGPSTTI